MFISDIIGGTPFNKAAEVSVGNERIILVSGCNPGSILEACLTKDELSFEELAESVIENTKNNVTRFELNISNSSQEPDNHDLGI